MAPAAEVEATGTTKAVEPPTKKQKTVLAKRKLPSLPVSNKILALLAELQKNVDPKAREAKIQAIVHTAVEKHGDLSTEANQYLLKRLINGAASSASYARLNYSAVLMRITREHPGSVDEVYATVQSIYGPGGSFKMDYARSAVGKTLGSLVSTAAVIRGASVKKINGDTAKNMLRMLRQTVVGEAQKWGLGAAAINVVRELLANVKEIEQLKKVLWRWAEDRKATHDGITMALMIFLEYKLIPENSIAMLYKSIDHVAKPLMAMFETGFSREKKNDAVAADVKDAEGFSECPLAWSLILRYCATKKGRDHLGGVSTFWEKVVTPNLITLITNLDKNILLRSLFPIAVSLLSEDEKIESILSRETLMKLGPGMFHVLAKRKLKMSPSESSSYNRFLTLEKALPEQLGNLCSDTEVPEERRTFLSEKLMRWVCCHGHFSPGSEKLVATIPQSLTPSMANEVFFKLLYFFLVPYRAPIREIERTRLVHLIVLERIVTAHPTLANAFIHALITASVFTDSKSQTAEAILPEKLDKIDVSQLTAIPDPAWKNMKRFKKDLEKGKTSTALPCPQPVLSAEYARKSYFRLMDFLLKGKNPSERVEKAAYVIQMLVSKSDSNQLKIRRDCDVMEEKYKQFCDATKKLNKANRSDEGTLKCLKLITNYFIVWICEPRGSETFVETEVCSEFVETIEKFCRITTKGKKPEGPDAMEATTHLLCVMCAENQQFGSIAKLGAGLLGESADDGVTAVLFDMLYAAKKGDANNDELGDSDEEEEDEEVVEMSVEEEEEEDAEMDDVVGNTIQDKDVDKEDESESEGDIFDAEVDPDTEDPKVLKMFDDHLSKHMMLLADKKKKAYKQRMQTHENVQRLLNIIGVVANSIRLRVERKNAEIDEKAILVFFDLFLRLVEFVLSNEFDASQYAKRVLEICDKLMSKKAVFVNHIKNVDQLVDFSSRLSAVSNRCRINALKPTIRRLVMVVKEVFDGLKEKTRKKKNVKGSIEDIEKVLKKLEK